MADRDYRVFVREQSFRYSLVIIGLAPVDIFLEITIPADIDSMNIADIRGKMTEQARLNLQYYINRGGNLLMMLKPQTSEVIKIELDKL